MKKQFWLAIIGILIVISIGYGAFCALDKQNIGLEKNRDNGAQKIKMTESQIFDKKIECSELNIDSLRAIGSVGYEIFYSPKLNTCVLIEHTIGGDTYNNYLIDALTHELIWEEAPPSFEQKIDELKNIE